MLSISLMIKTMPMFATGPAPRRLAAMLAALSCLIGSMAPAAAENRQVAKLRAAERKTFTDAQIVEGFFKIALAAEYRVAGRVDAIRKYDGPVRVHIESRARPDRRQQIAEVVADIRARVKNLDIAVIDDRSAANLAVTLVRNRDLTRTLTAFYGRQRSSHIQRSLDPQCLSSFHKDDTLRIVNSNVVLVVDAGEFIFYDCAYEELLQALGPINDDSSVPWTMFNDRVQKGFFGLYDQYLLNLLYHPRVRPGMTKAELRDLIPQILPEVRAWVAQVNDLKP